MSEAVGASRVVHVMHSGSNQGSHLVDGIQTLLLGQIGQIERKVASGQFRNSQTPNREKIFMPKNAINTSPPPADLTIHTMENLHRSDNPTQRMTSPSERRRLIGRRAAAHSHASARETRCAAGTSSGDDGEGRGRGERERERERDPSLLFYLEIMELDCDWLEDVVAALS
ncbi:hypothetical protein EYF80_040348 [Liparis tanakae]|uniref:Uncharacterized protein n=1 Tax=Liparis tanakae TaxID=230148 RepID=A0A4Z2GA71_9TELE|nr:hypothetical protein EYF80_040348 [Liparis tanakae]